MANDEMANGEFLKPDYIFFFKLPAPGSQTFAIRHFSLSHYLIA